MSKPFFQAVSSCALPIIPPIACVKHLVLTTFLDALPHFPRKGFQLNHSEICKKSFSLILQNQEYNYEEHYVNHTVKILSNILHIMIYVKTSYNLGFATLMGKYVPDKITINISHLIPCSLCLIDEKMEHTSLFFLHNTDLNFTNKHLHKYNLKE